MNKISAVVITYNEEKNIERCLNSLLQVADEILVLDSYSTDQTEAICKKLNVAFYQRKFDGYGTQKSAAVALAKHDFILSLDADECLDDKLIHEIANAKLSNLKNLYKLNRITWLVSDWVRHSGWYPDCKIRLWHRDHAEWTKSDLHEVVSPIIKTETIETLDGNILHYSFMSHEDHLSQIENFSNLAAKQYYNQGKKPNFIDLWIKPMYKFLNIYILKAGFLDGHLGWLISTRSAKGVKRKYEILNQLWKQAL